jgi:hypothetical protein
MTHFHSIEVFDATETHVGTVRFAHSDHHVFGDHSFWRCELCGDGENLLRTQSWKEGALKLEEHLGDEHGSGHTPVLVDQSTLW